MAQAKKTYPDPTLQNAIHNAGGSCRAFWEIPGPRDTQVAWITCYSVTGGDAPLTVLVLTYGLRGVAEGWDAFLPGDSNRVDVTVAGVLERAGLPRKL